MPIQDIQRMFNICNNRIRSDLSDPCKLDPICMLDTKEINNPRTRNSMTWKSYQSNNINHLMHGVHWQFMWWDSRDSSINWDATPQCERGVWCSYVGTLHAIPCSLYNIAPSIARGTMIIINFATAPCVFQQPRTHNITAPCARKPPHTTCICALIRDGKHCDIFMTLITLHNFGIYK